MSITRRVLDIRHGIWAIIIALVAFGSAAYVFLPVQLFPDTSPPLVNVVTVFPGATAEDIADKLSRPLEDEFSSLEAVVRVKSSSQDNLSVVSIEFQYDRTVELAAVDVQNAIAAIRGKLPASIHEPQVLKFSTSDRPVVTFGIAGDDLVEARRFAEDVLGPALQRIHGVAAVDVFGGHRKALLVELSVPKLEAHRVSINQVVEAIRAFNVDLPAGVIRSNGQQAMLRVENEAADPQSLAQIPIPTKTPGRLTLGDIGRITSGALDSDAAFSVDGQSAIAVQVLKATDGNTVEIVEQADRIAKEITGKTPGLTLLVGEETASFTRESISNLLGNIWQALLFASIIIFFFLGRWGSSLVAAASMILSYMSTFALMYATGTELNMVTLTAVILAVGMVVDASVVVIENAEAWRLKGFSPIEAVIRGTDEIRGAIIAGAATTLAVLIPLQFLPGFVGKTFGPLARTLMFAFSSSLLIALFVVPVLTTYTVDRSKFDRLAGELTGPFAAVMARLRDLYVKLLRFGLRYRKSAVVFTLVIFVAGIAGLRQRGAEVLPRMDTGSFYVSIETESGSSLESTARAIASIEAMLQEEPEVINIQSQAGFELGMKSFGGSGVQGSTQGFISVTLTPRTEREEDIWSIEERVRNNLTRIPGLQAFTVKEIGNTAKSTTVAPIVIRFSGKDPLILDRLGSDAMAILKGVPSITNPGRSWRMDFERTQVSVDPLRAAELGVSPAFVAQQMAFGAGGVEAGDFSQGLENPYPIQVRYEQQSREKPADLLRFPLFSPASPSPIPLSWLASFETVVGQGLVTRENATQTLELTAYLRDTALNFTVADVESALSTLEMPDEYTMALIGENRDMGEAAQALGGALAIALVAVYLLLLAQLRSFLQPLTIMMSIPLSLIGVSIALGIAGKMVSMPVMVGMILLVGTVVNNAIILLDFVASERAAGAERRDALVEAVRLRFRPIMMTSLSTIVGMIPLAAEWALGAERFAPLATAVIGGMTSATFLTLVLIPILYDLFDDLYVRAGGKPSPVKEAQS